VAQRSVFLPNPWVSKNPRDPLIRKVSAKVQPWSGLDTGEDRPRADLFQSMELCPLKLAYFGMAADRFQPIKAFLLPSNGPFERSRYQGTFIGGQRRRTDWIESPRETIGKCFDRHPPLSDFAIYR
jgi:hypothetical protein